MRFQLTAVKSAAQSYPRYRNPSGKPLASLMSWYGTMPARPKDAVTYLQLPMRCTNRGVSCSNEFNTQAFHPNQSFREKCNKSDCLKCTHRLVTINKVIMMARGTFCDGSITSPERQHISVTKRSDSVSYCIAMSCTVEKMA